MSSDHLIKTFCRRRCYILKVPCAPLSSYLWSVRDRWWISRYNMMSERWKRDSKSWLIWLKMIQVWECLWLILIQLWECLMINNNTGVRLSVIDINIGVRSYVIDINKAVRVWWLIIIQVWECLWCDAARQCSGQWTEKLVPTCNSMKVWPCVKISQVP